AAILALIVVLALNMAVILLNFVFFPLPEGVAMDDAAAMAAWMSDLPQTAFILPIVAHLVQAFAGGWVAARVGASIPMVLAMIIGGLSLLGGVLNLLQIPGPIWMWAELPLYLVLAWAAGALEVRRRRQA
ncbi:MAG: hypothetical protein AB8H79_01830, partial [Myxococcota bacterium]